VANLKTITLFLAVLSVCTWIGRASPAAAASEEPGMPVVSVIEAFVTKQFPDASSRYWIAEITSDTTEHELVLDLHAFVRRHDRPVSEERFLLLVVEGRLAAVQGLALDQPADCQPDSGDRVRKGHEL
jgi:hypothetical protein